MSQCTNVDCQAHAVHFPCLICNIYLLCIGCYKSHAQAHSFFGNIWNDHFVDQHQTSVDLVE